MERPLTLTARGVDLPPGLEQEIRERVAALERFYPRLVGCEVRVEGPGRRHLSGGPYAVNLDLRVPGADPILVNRQGQERLERAVDDAFDVAVRRLEDLLRLQRGKVKTHEPPQTPARVMRLFPEESWGLLETADHREVYFHRNSVLGDFDLLRVGDRVRFHEETGNEGPQASTVVAE
jgi:cold shock CspA family protein